MRLQRLLVLVFIALALSSSQAHVFAQGGSSGQASPAELADINAQIDAIFERVGQLRAAGRFKEAQQLAEELVAVVRQIEPEGSALAAAMQTLAFVYQEVERHLEAEKLLADALAMQIRVLGPDDPEVAIASVNLARYYSAIQEFAKSNELCSRGLAIFEKATGPESRDLGRMLTTCAGQMSNQGRYIVSEQMIRRAVTILEREPSERQGALAESLASLAIVLKQTGRLEEAEALHKRAGAIWESPQSQNRVFHMQNFGNLGTLYLSMGRLDEAEASLKRGVELARQIFGRRHSAAVDPLGWLGDLYRRQKRFKEARKAYKEADALVRAVAAKSDALSGAKLGLAYLDIDEGRRYEQAERQILDYLPRMKSILGPNYPDVAEAYHHLGTIAERRSDWDKAAASYRQALAIWQARQTTAVPPASRYEDDHTLSNRRTLHSLVETLWRLRLAQASQPQPAGGHDVTAEAFASLQRASSSASATALAQMARRHVVSDTEVAKLIRESQDLDQQWLALDQTIAKARAAATQADERYAKLRKEIDRVEARRSELASTLAGKFPQQSQLITDAPVSLAEAQRLLKPGEALVVFLATERSTFVMAASDQEFSWQRLDIAPDALGSRVRALRCGLDAAAWDGDGEKSCQELLATQFTSAEAAQGRALPFDAAIAHAIYRELFGPVEPLIKGRSLVIVPSGSLIALPFNALVTEPPAAKAEYRSVIWLGIQAPIVVLPSVSNLKALRAFAKTSAAALAFLGVGNPILAGDPASADQASRARQAQAFKRCGDETQLAALGLRSGEIPLFGAAGLADVAELRRQLPLPETAGEVCSVGRSLGVSGGELDAHVRFGQRATESEIKALSFRTALANYRIVHFATHAAMSGQVRGSAEPGLILTPPPTASDEDDGYLSASEVSQLKLDADWVILSACNTAAGGSVDSSALSGLARGFLYAGARSLLVSHWAVDSLATVRLITSAFENMRKDPTLGRAAAMRSAMADVLAAGEPDQAHPSRWAPFVLVGEGAAVR